MLSESSPSLAFEEIDDLLYFTRAHETTDLQQTISELSQKYQCQPGDVVKACIDPESGNTVLHFCSANGFADLVTSFLSQLTGDETSMASDSASAGASPLLNHANNEGNTPLHWAAYNGNLAIVKLLIAAGADMWIKNGAGHLAMFEAERAEKSDVVQYLLEAGGKEVESTGVEKPATAEDVEEVQSGEASSSVQDAEGAAVDMDSQASNG